MRFETIREWVYEEGYKIKDFGYRVFVTYRNGFCYLHFTDGKRIGYLDIGLGGTNVGMHGRPCYSVAEDVVEVTKEMCEKALTSGCPHWSDSGFIPTTFDEFSREKLNKEGIYEL